jgi:hypothetical protein
LGKGEAFSGVLVAAFLVSAVIAGEENDRVLGLARRFDLLKTPFVSAVSYLCPEPVLVKRSVFIYKWLKKRRFPHRPDHPPHRCIDLVHGRCKVSLDLSKPKQTFKCPFLRSAFLVFVPSLSR